MGVTPEERRLLAALANGLPLERRPYEALARQAGTTEEAVLRMLRSLRERGIVRRFGVVVRHHELGYRANAMCVWDVPDAEVGEAGRVLAAMPGVTLCYRRPRRPPVWPYNLFCMIHGRDRETVLRLAREAAAAAGIAGLPSAVLFSGRRYRQCGASFGPAVPEEARWTRSTGAS